MTMMRIGFVSVLALLSTAGSALAAGGSCYCGDCTSWTRDGTAIEFHHRLGIQPADRSRNMQFEEGWESDAVCVSHIRVLERIAIDELVRPVRNWLRSPLVLCHESEMKGRDEALIGNESLIY
jgi:hypothetical protein